MNRYQGNSGKMVRVEEERIKVPEPVGNMPKGIMRQNERPPQRFGTNYPKRGGGLADIFTSISGKTTDILGDIVGIRAEDGAKKESLVNSLIAKFKNIDLDTDDLIILLVIWLMYRDSKDEELLIVMAVMLFS